MPDSRSVATLVLEAKNLASANVKALQKDLGKLDDAGAKSQAVLRRTAAVAQGALGIGLAFAAAGAGELADTQARLQADTGASAESAHAMALAVNEIAGASRTALPDVEAVMAKVVSGMGLSGQAATDATRQIVDFARVTRQDAGAAATAVDGIGDAWGLTADQALAVLGKLLVSQQRYGTVVGDSEKALTDLAPALRAANTSYDDAIGLLNIMEVSGLDAASAGAALKKSIAGLKPGQSLQDLVSQIGAIEDPTKRAQAAIAVFGSKGGAGLANALRPGRDSLRDFAVSDTDGLGAIQKGADALDATFPATIKRMLSEAQASLRGFGSEFGETLMAGAAAASLANSLGLPLAGALKASLVAAAGSPLVIAAAVIAGVAIGDGIRKGMDDAFHKGQSSGPGFIDMVLGFLDGKNALEDHVRSMGNQASAAADSLKPTIRDDYATLGGVAGSSYTSSAAAGIDAGSDATTAAARQSVIDAAQAVRSAGSVYASAWQDVLSAKDRPLDSKDELTVLKAELARAQKATHTGTSEERAQAWITVRSLKRSIAANTVEGAFLPGATGTVAGRGRATVGASTVNAPVTVNLTVNSSAPISKQMIATWVAMIDAEFARRTTRWAGNTRGK